MAVNLLAICYLLCCIYPALCQTCSWRNVVVTERRGNFVLRISRQPCRNRRLLRMYRKWSNWGRGEGAWSLERPGPPRNTGLRGYERSVKGVHEITHQSVIAAYHFKHRCRVITGCLLPEMLLLGPRGFKKILGWLSLAIFYGPSVIL